MKMGNGNFVWSCALIALGSTGCGSEGMNPGEEHLQGSLQGSIHYLASPAGEVGQVGHGSEDAAPISAEAWDSGPVIYATDFVSAGVGGMRDIGSGTITLGGVTGQVNLALLYWHGPTRSTDPASNADVAFAGTNIAGTNIGTASDNCWEYSNSQSYVADVTELVPGNGSYALSNFGGDSTVNTNGASLLVFFDDGDSSNNRDVVVFHGNDSNIAHPGDPGGWDVSLSGIEYTSGTASMQLHVADGQIFSDDALILNSSILVAAGPIFSGNSVPSANNGPGNNGSLWDIGTYDVTSYLSPGPNTLHLTTGVSSDCLGLVVAAVDLPAGAAPEQPNSPPQAHAGVDQAVACAGPDGAQIALDGTASSDPDGDELTFAWSAPGVSFDDPASPTPTATFPPGVTVVTLTVTDPSGASDSDQVEVIVDEDTTPPLVVVAPMLELWPPNHEYASYRLSDCVIAVEDACDGELDIDQAGQIIAIYSDEPENTTGDGNTVNDIIIVDSSTFMVRAERRGMSDGRVYTVMFSVTNGQGNSTTASCSIGVPHDRSGAPAVDSGSGSGYMVTP